MSEIFFGLRDPVWGPPADKHHTHQISYNGLQITLFLVLLSAINLQCVEKLCTFN